jgi:NADH:ubiquinone oxidoreductase subunit 3 (subunit A)
MNNISQSRTNKIALALLIIAGIFWLGAINVRALIGNELLDYDQFDFKTSIPPDRENTLFQLLSNASLVIVISYFVVFVCAILFMKTTHLKIKENGWLLMSAILFFMFAPVEMYTYYIDIKFMLLFQTHPPNHDELLRLFGKRLGALSGVPVIALLSYYSIVVISVFKPLRRPAKVD